MVIFYKNKKSLTIKKQRKIVFTGPESSGKTSMAKAVSKACAVNWLPEYARTYLNQLNRSYVPTDLVKIAQGQLLAQQEFAKNNSDYPFLFFDTSLLVIKVWSIFKYGYYNFQLEKLLRANLPDIFFLCDWHIPWEFDPLREAPNDKDRNALYAIYQKELSNLEVPFFELKGTEEERLLAVHHILVNLS